MCECKKGWFVYCQLPLENSISIKFCQNLKDSKSLVLCTPALQGYELLSEEGVDIKVISSQRELDSVIKNSAKNNIFYLQADPLLLDTDEYQVYEKYKFLDRLYLELLGKYGFTVEEERIKDTWGEESLVYLMHILRILRSDQGCPWDKKQTHESLKPHLLEEAYEVIEAIDEKSKEDLCEELGDLLLQVIFHTRIAQEEGYFYISEVIKGLEKKIIRRHPHVFGEEKASNVSEVMKTWNEVKKKEGKKDEGKESEHLSPSKNLPALLRAEKMQEQASKVGFDWDDIEGAFAKLKEEARELEDAYMTGNKERIEEEVGDIVFSLVNVARFLNISPELALNKTIDKFYARFTYIEKCVSAKGEKVSDCHLEKLDKLWEKAKKSGF